MTPQPPRFTNKPTKFDPAMWNANAAYRGETSKYLRDPGEVETPYGHTAGSLAHARPYLVAGGVIFSFPVGVEGFRRSGSAKLGLHHYIGDNSVAGETIHSEEARIELSGIFPGNTARLNMINCINVLRAYPPSPGLLLFAPGVFNKVQYVLAENWDFSHAEDDRTHSINYTITFVRTGEGKKVADPKGIPIPQNPSTKTNGKGKPQRTITVKDGLRTFRGISKKVYGTENQWNKLVTINKTQINTWQKAHKEIPQHQLPSFVWPIGTKFRY